MSRPATLPRRGWPRALLACAAIALPCVAVGRAEEAGGAKSGRDSQLSAKPLAAAPVQQPVKAPPQPQMYENPVAARPMAVGDAVAAAMYQPAQRSDWKADRVDRDDPWVRLLLIAPSRPVVIDAAVLVDGAPFRAAEEAQLDELASPTPTAMEMATKLLDTLSAAATKVQAAAAKAKLETAAPEEKSEGKTDDQDDQSEESKTQNPESKIDATAEEDEDEKDDDANEDAKESDDDSPPTTEIVTRTAPALAARLADFAAAQGRPASREEIRWLVEQWTSAPGPRILAEEFSWQRAAVAPLLAALDSDGDGSLAAPEIAAALESLADSDSDQNDVVEIREMQGYGADVISRLPSRTHPLLLSIASDVTDRAVARALAAAYDGTPQASADYQAQAAELRRRDADLVLRVELGAADATIELLSVGPELKDAEVFADDKALAIAAGDLGLECAAFGGPSAADEAWPPLVAVGAALDGSPLMRLVDADADGRLTRRERQTIPAMLQQLDRDDDGGLTPAEIGSPIRLVFARGLGAHAALATSAPAVRRATAPAATPAAPEWFAAMDANGDGDLSRDEFAGSGEQFAGLDGDGDGLVSPGEAAGPAMEGGGP